MNSSNKERNNELLLRYDRCVKMKTLFDQIILMNDVTHLNRINVLLIEIKHAIRIKEAMNIIRNQY